MIAGKKHAFSQLRMDLGTLTPTQLSLKWDCKYHQFLTDICSKNGTVALHHGMLLHAVSIVGLHDAERLEDHQGLPLLLAIVKKVSSFSYLNASSSYAVFCSDLLHYHGQASPFHQSAPSILFSYPWKCSSCNLALDSQREMDHRTAAKAFRPCSSPDSNVFGRYIRRHGITHS